MNIRLEQPKDYREVENLTREAFWNVYHPGCTEHYVLNQYRTNPDFIPGLDLVMIEDDKIIGHVMFSKAEIILDDGTNFPSWTLAQRLWSEVIAVCVGEGSHDGHRSSADGGKYRVLPSRRLRPRQQA